MPVARVRRPDRSWRGAPQTLRRLGRLPYDNLGFARVDTHRAHRRGVPEAVLCDGKTPEQIVRIARRLKAHQQVAILTRLDPSVYERIAPALPRLRYLPHARLAVLHPSAPGARRGLVAVITGGTADLPVAEEAAATLEALGSRVVRVYDAGVAGLHRLLASWPVLRRARALVVVAGMEGALPSVVGGLVRSPVIAVPTSVGYGASFDGIGPLLTMLNSCVPGIGVVNIDNGYGGGYLAHLINCPPPTSTTR